MKIRGLAAATLIAACAPAFAAERDRTSLPVDCSDRNVTCVLDDGGPTVQRAVGDDSRRSPGAEVPVYPSQLPSGPGNRGDARPADGGSGAARGRGR